MKLTLKKIRTPLARFIVRWTNNKVNKQTSKES